MILTIAPVPHLKFSGTLPADPLVAQAALFRAVLACGESRLNGVPDDSDLTILYSILSRLGCTIERGSEGLRIVSPEHFIPPTVPLNTGNAGYVFRLLTGLLAAQPHRATLTAEPPLLRRNIERTLEPLRELGAVASSTDRGTPPVHLFPAQLRNNAVISLPLPNLYLKSTLIVAAAAAGVACTIAEPEASREFIEHIFGCSCSTSSDNRYAVQYNPPELHSPVNWILPSDSVLADHLTAIAILRAGSSLRIQHRSTLKSELRMLSLMEQFGVHTAIDERAETAGQPTGTLQIISSGVQGRLELDSIRGIASSVPLLAVVAGCGTGCELTVHGAMDMRQQACDRIAAIVDNLATFGITTEEFDDGFCVRSAETVHGGRHISAYDDPVIATAMIVLCACSDEPSVLYDIPDDTRVRFLARLLNAEESK